MSDLEVERRDGGAHYATIVLDVTRLPEVVAEMRREFAHIVLEAAQDEEPRVAARLVQLAAQFEVGAEEDA